MNKKVVNQELQPAYEALAEAKIANEKGEIDKAFRGHISSFGAAVTMGSLLAAIAFFGKDAGAEVSRSRLMDAILLVLKKCGKAESRMESLFEYAQKEEKAGREEACQEEILNATIAIKLSMNLYNLVEK